MPSPDIGSRRTKQSRACLIAGLLVVLLIVFTSAISCGRRKTEGDPKDIATIELTGRDSTTVFELLNEAHEVQFKQSSLGTFVTGIDTLEVTPETFWVYTVNDSMPDVGADRCTTQAGDRVVWHLREANW
ncbi:DUF4430 domain-containing protein [candidate division GN15 bacterium]|nr:DUF4430 domain-containing protein [candidate division GN15 bacterium]